ncbi:hypothetical protein, partial [Rhodoplanes sp.]|uniref:hypothetical protein n=1 Tax=Rhodoplanes sp. TaxID=1968906 RepID=UPI00345B8C87
AVNHKPLTLPTILWVRTLIPTASEFNRCPLSGGDRSDAARLGEEIVPGVTAGADDGSIIVEDAI